MAGVRLRTGDLDQDYEALRALWEASGPAITLGPSDTFAELQRKLTRDPDLFVVAMAGKRLAGAVLGGWDGRRGAVYHLAVDARMRGKGIGAALMAELEARFRLKGCTRLKLFVTGGNVIAVAFYERLGWERLDATGMAKTIDPVGR